MSSRFENALNFRKIALSKRFAWFGRPCRGLRTLTGLCPQPYFFYMTRRAVLALRVILPEGKSRFWWSFKRIWFGVSSGTVFRRFLWVHEFFLHGAWKINYFRSSRIRLDWRQVLEKIVRGPIFEKCNWLRYLKIHWIFGKPLSPKKLIDFGGPAGGSEPWRVFAPNGRGIFIIMIYRLICVFFIKDSCLDCLVI